MPTESAASSSSSQPDHHHHHPTQPVEDRIVRAIRHRLRLLHRSESDFFVLGATGNVYTVTLSSTPSCTCPDRTIPCKHILFILIRVLGVPLEDGCLRRRTLRPCELSRLLTTPTAPGYLAGASVREKFHQLFLEAAGRRRRQQEQASSSLTVEDGATCPVCLEELGSSGEEKVVVACGTCRNPIHEECLMTWKRSRRRRSTTCVICRARWRNNRGDDDQEERYLNLSAFVSEEDDDTINMAEAGSSLPCID